jgi:carboxysome shell carbonic anhydrase
MLNARYKNKRSLSWSQATAPLGRPGARIDSSMSDNRSVVERELISSATRKYQLNDNLFTGNRSIKNALHPLTRNEINSNLFGYERNIKAAFDEVEQTLNEVKNLQVETDFEIKMKTHIRKKLGIEIPESMVNESWRSKPDMHMRNLYAWCLFEVYQRYCNSFMGGFPTAMGVKDFQSFIQDCGFHTVDVSPCADGRLAHVISYVLRLPYRAVRRKAYAGAMFDVEDSLDKWVETELKRFREGFPDTPDTQTRYLKTVIYHFSSLYPEQEGCAAHGSNAELAAQAGKERLYSFKQAVENTYCCGASIDQLLIGLDTDNDIIRIHVPNEHGEISLTRCIDASEIYRATHEMLEDDARTWIMDFVEGENPQMSEGLVKFISFLLVNNISQIDYVRTYHGEYYKDIGHAERFIGVGKGFAEVQLRNLTFFSYLKTVEESANDLDVGVKIFKTLNVSKGLPIPVVVRFDYHGNVPGSRERAIEHCYRVNNALSTRYKELVSQGLLHILMVIKNINTVSQIEKLGCSIKSQATQEAH